MQSKLAPLGAGVYTGTPAVLQKEVDAHLDRYVFCLEDIDVNDRVLSVGKINRARFTRLTDKTYVDLDWSEEALTREEVPGQEDTQLTKTYLKTAKNSALELYGAYGERGLVIINALTGKDTATVKAIEAELLSDVPDKLVDFYAVLASKVFQENKAAKVVEAVRDELLHCLEVTQSYREKVVADAESEIAQRASGKEGIAKVTSGVKFYADSLGRVLDSERLEQIAQKQNEPVKVTIEQQPIDHELIATIAAQAAAKAVEAILGAQKKDK